MEFEAWIEAQGFKLDELSGEQKENLRKLYAQKVQIVEKKEEEDRPAASPAPVQASQAQPVPAPGGRLSKPT